MIIWKEYSLKIKIQGLDQMASWVNPNFAVYQLCDFSKSQDLSAPHFPHVENRRG